MRDHELLRRFLLGELREKKAERVEKRLLEDDELFELSEIVETELLDAVARGELAPAERERVVQRLASSPQGRARLALAGELIAIANGQTKTDTMPAPLPFRPRPALTQRPAVRWAIAAGLVVLLGGTGTIWWDATHTNQEEQNEIAQNHAEPGEAPGQGTIHVGPVPPVAGPDTGDTPPEDVAPPPADPNPVAVEPPAEDEVVALKPVAFQLASLVRGPGDGLPKVEIPAGTDYVQFEMDAKAYTYESYSTTVTRDSEVVWSDGHLKPQQITGGPVLVLDVPVSELPAGIYTVEIQGNPAEGTPKLVMEKVFEVTHEQ